MPRAGLRCGRSSSMNGKAERQIIKRPVLPDHLQVPQPIIGNRHCDQRNPVKKRWARDIGGFGHLHSFQFGQRAGARGSTHLPARESVRGGASLC